MMACLSQPHYLPVSGGGAVSLNALTTSGNSSDGKCQQASGATTITLTGITVAAGSNRRLFAVLVWDNSQTTRTLTALVGGSPSAMTEEVYATFNKAVGIYSIANPDTGAQSIVASFDNTSDVYLSAICFNGVASVNGADDIIESDNSIIINSGANDATLSVIGTDNGDPTSSKTRFFANSPLGPGGGADYALGGVTNTHTWGNAGTAQTCIGIHIVAA